jgi:response regulator RpfG family c-di-GMP phosphodiesterase
MGPAELKKLFLPFEQVGDQKRRAEGTGLETDQKESRIAGCDAFLPKPVEKDKLLAHISTLLQAEWIYRDESHEKAAQEEALDEERETNVLIAPPLKELEIFYELAMLGKMSRLRKPSIHLERLGQQYVPFATKIRELAELFERKQIILLVKQFLTASNSTGRPGPHPPAPSYMLGEGPGVRAG